MTLAPGFLAHLNTRYGHLDGSALLRPLLLDALKERIALVSSFGADAAVLLALAAEINPAVPVIFLQTGKLFQETLDYRDLLTERLGLTDVRSVEPDPQLLSQRDPDGFLWFNDADACCALRKTEPLTRALAGFDAWITGRKAFQAATRAALPVMEEAEGRIKINPLANWDADQIAAEFAKRNLPPHPLVAKGYPSIGCQPCTHPVAPGADPRSGRWAGLDKTECGIHINPSTTQGQD